MGATLLGTPPAYTLSGTPNFGLSVSLNASGTILAVGAQGNNSGNGAVVLFQWNGSLNLWAQMGATLLAYDGASYNYNLSSSSLFGRSVALNASGTVLAVGAFYNNTNRGAVVLFQWNGSAWAQMGATLIGTPPAYDLYGSSPYFGISAALNASGSVLAAGAYGDNTNVGAVVSFKLVHKATRYCNSIASNKNIIVAGGGPTNYSSSSLAYSNDNGLTWNNSDSDNDAHTFPFSGQICHAVAWNGSRWVAGGSGTNPLAYSYNGKTWYQSTNGATLLGETFVCNAVAWNGKYWMASIEGASVGGQTQLYSNDGMTWIASKNGNTLFIETNQALALATVKSGQSDVTTSQSDVQGDVTTLQSDVTTLQSDVTTLQSDVTTLQSDVTTLQSDVTTLEGDVTTLQSDVTTLQSDVTTLQSDVTTLQSSIMGTTWTDVSGARVFNTLYTNNTTKLRFVMITGYVFGSSSFAVKVNGNIIAELQSVHDTYMPVSFVVPPSSTYELKSYSGPILRKWYEFL
jgi:outer membrane murein-binding lipoprotein Lpp